MTEEHSPMDTTLIECLRLALEVADPHSISDPGDPGERTVIDGSFDWGVVAQVFQGKLHAAGFRIVDAAAITALVVSALK